MDLLLPPVDLRALRRKIQPATKKCKFNLPFRS
jgi:hypothetical protein